MQMVKNSIFFLNLLVSHYLHRSSVEGGLSRNRAGCAMKVINDTIHGQISLDGVREEFALYSRDEQTKSHQTIRPCPSRISGAHTRFEYFTWCLPRRWDDGGCNVFR